ncbi:MULTISPECIES: response regulator [unclassified Microbacterium]|uniref:response regulator n=1 Tax=unclassified Microbacterium TaxID=2609290 RepID=UPI00214B315C|nr:MULTISPECIES: response regulator [unclassified Microbacterium]MCR2784780.1 response regulator [Microbacterium sp. zg.B96]MDL5352768.1 response regulator [Microbacterium sp. zg-YB36]WIM16319.1 response regulator [Microbacterium sp. zg-B96]
MLRVLLADDDPDIRDMTAELLGRRGCVVTMVASGEEALAVLAAETFDVLVLDQNMPPGSGTSVATARRALGDTTPIVLWTGWSGTLDANELERLEIRLVNKAGPRQLIALVLELGQSD